ncbi:ABC-type nitrate/sulfonate/bicarbonate transport system permease component [Microbacterium endophyticum]|uniref:ABC transporter permease n=1 Tax=Microbacterium endophyticum TaxID=1526412 RepID=UPI0019D0667C|nr:ABC transporter permease [Microbacterium endophyticum]NIK36174.1 ABC-type nitrate/sulfonate/bicarbonate transport system permease component [Microbacterium endophyticum]
MAVVSATPFTSTNSPAGPSRRSRNRRRMRSARKVILGFAGLLGFLATWQLLPALGIVNPLYVPYATQVLAQLAAETTDLEFWRNIGRTLTSWGLGLLIATVLAVFFGVIIGLVPFLRRATHTTIEFLRPIPSVALIPLAILLFGFQIQAALLIIVYASFWQVFVQVLYGVADVDTVARDTARSFGLSRASRFRYLVLPTALPYIMTGVRLAAAVALILAVTAELVMGIPGIGRQIVFAQSAGDWPTVYAYVVVAGLLGLLVNMAFRLIERRALSWHQSVRGEELV